jgi:hypothetical protein
VQILLNTDSRIDGDQAMSDHLDSVVKEALGPLRRAHLSCRGPPDRCEQRHEWRPGRYSLHPGSPDRRARAGDREGSRCNGASAHPGRGPSATTLRGLIREYLFITLFRACAESLVSENASRLAAMERADRNIKELLEHLHGRLRRQRQGSIDEELFDVTAGYEALAST